MELDKNGVTVIRFNGFFNEIKRFDDDFDIRFTAGEGDEYVIRMDVDLWMDLTLMLTKKILSSFSAAVRGS